MANIINNVKTFIIDNFLFGDADGLENDTSFLDEGIIDSTGVLELVEYLEREFHISVDDEELIPENLDSLVKVATYVERKQQS